MTEPDRFPHPKPSPSEVTRVLQGADGARAEHLFPLVHGELRRIAANYLRGEDNHHTLQPTALVNEAFVRLAAPAKDDWQSRAHFYGVAARAMRQVLVDHARKKKAAKRGGGAPPEQTGLDNIIHDEWTRQIDVLDLNEALERLHVLNERKARVVELRFFAGLNFKESGHLLGVSPKTIEADWYMARAWLRRELER